MTPRRTIIIHEFESPDTAWDFRAQLAGDEDPAHHGWGADEKQALADLLLLEADWLAEEVAKYARQQRRILKEQP